MSIGEVLVMLKTEFHDVTISKIRFLEGEGLIDPERTPSGYRKFYDKDIDRLRAILRMQRDEYLPLKVIKDRIDQTEESASPARSSTETAQEELAVPPTGLQMSEDELSAARTCVSTSSVPDPGAPCAGPRRSLVPGPQPAWP